MHLDSLATPALVLDGNRLTSNLTAMRARAQAAGIALRPHLKTAKSAHIARLATAAEFRAVTVSTLAEAEYFLAAGFADITYAVCMVPGKLARAIELIRAGARLSLLVDSEPVAGELARAASANAVQLSVLIEIDSGEHRTGVAWDAPALTDIAARIHGASHLGLAGVLTHGGHSYGCDSVADIVAVAEQERQAVVSAAQRLRTAGFACPTVSAGSTPTAVHGRSFAGLSEIRPGVYMFMDLAQHGLGVCEWRDIAISVLATVISQQPEHNRIIIDAGGLALSKDTSANRRLPDAGYGWVMTVDGQRRIGDLRVAAVDQEHGFVTGSEIPYDALPVGARVRVLPNHACMTAAAYHRYAVVEGPEVTVVDTWTRMNGW